MSDKRLSLPLSEYEQEIKDVYLKGLTSGYGRALGVVKALLEGRHSDVKIADNADEEEKRIWEALKQALPEVKNEQQTGQ